MKREATLVECYNALRYNGADILSAAFLGFILFMRKTMIEEV